MGYINKKKIIGLIVDKYSGIENCKVDDIISFAKMMIQGEEFDPSVCHCIDDSNGKTQFKFTLSSTPFFGKDTWVLNFI